MLDLNITHYSMLNSPFLDLLQDFIGIGIIWALLMLIYININGCLC